MLSGIRIRPNLVLQTHPFIHFIPHLQPTAHHQPQLLGLTPHPRRIALVRVLARPRPLGLQLCFQPALDRVQHQVAYHGQELPRMRRAARGDVDALEARVARNDEVGRRSLGQPSTYQYSILIILP